MCRSELRSDCVERPLVSIVIPAYNAEQHIDECLYSISNQSYEKIEVVVVDDGSKDKTADLCLLWEKRDSRFSVIRQANQGVSAARNKGLRESSGEWVLFVDADDQLEAEAIEKTIKASSGADVVIYGIAIVDGGGATMEKVLPPRCESMSSLALSQEIAKGNFQEFSPCYLFKRSLLDAPISNDGPYETGISLFEDALVIQKVLRTNDLTIKCLPEVLYLYRQTDSSASHRCNPGVARSGLKAISMLEAIGSPIGCEAEWRAKLVMMLVETVDRVAGPGIWDGQSALHHEINQKVRGIASSGALRFPSCEKRLKYALFRLHLYRLIRRLYTNLKRFSRSRA